MVSAVASDVLIVGGGVIGLACAFRLAEAGVGVALIEAGEQDGAATGPVGPRQACWRRSARPVSVSRT